MSQIRRVILITGVILGFMILSGLALDVGRDYSERNRIQRAVDAATLAGVVELPSEEQAFIRSINYLDQNGYPLKNEQGQDQVNIYIRGCAHGFYLSETTDTTDPNRLMNRGTVLTDTPYLYYPPGGIAVRHPIAEFILDTRSYQETDDSGNFLPDEQQCENAPSPWFGTAHKFSVNGTVPLHLNLMQILGWDDSVSVQSIAQNVTSLDVVIVFDISGSMMYAAKEPVKNFINRLNPQFDQVAFVSFECGEMDGRSRTKLQCVKWAGLYAGGRINCYGGTNPITFTHVFAAIDNYQQPNQSHDIAQGLREGLEEFGVRVEGDTNNRVDSQCTDGVNHPDHNGDGHACDRGKAVKRVLVLLTDGVPHQNPGSCAPGDGRPDLWNDPVNPDDDNYECAMYYAQQAQQNKIFVYTIGVGSEVNGDLLNAIAFLGQNFSALSAQELDTILHNIFSSPGPRLAE